jgi:hypothetical protein
VFITVKTSCSPQGNTNMLKPLDSHDTSSYSYCLVAQVEMLNIQSMIICVRKITDTNITTPLNFSCATHGGITIRTLVKETLLPLKNDPLKSTGNLVLPDCTALQPRRQPSSYSLP